MGNVNVERGQTTAIEHRKNKGIWDHEFLSVSIHDRTTGLSTVVFIDRDWEKRLEDLPGTPGQPPDDLDNQENQPELVQVDPNGCLEPFSSASGTSGLSIPATETPSPSPSSSLQSNIPSSKIFYPSAEIASIFAQGKAFDSVHRGQNDRSKFDQSIGLASIKFAENQEPTVIQFAFMASAVSSFAPVYKLKKSSCYWYARSIFDHCQSFGGTSEPLEGHATTGLWKNFNYVHYWGTRAEITSKFKADYELFQSRQSSSEEKGRREGREALLRELADKGVDLASLGLS